jgi:uroporphyrinogen-III synthase
VTEGPLTGRVVVVTRPAGQGRSLADRLRSLGAEAIEAPAIELQGAEHPAHLDRAVAEAAGGEFDWIVFTSAAGVRAWFERAEGLGAERPPALVAAVGDATAEALRGGGIEPDLVPDPFTTEALGRRFPRGRGRVLLPRADLASTDLEDALREKGWMPVRLDAYRVRPAEALPPEAEDALRRGRVDAITFTSPSTVEGFVRLAGAISGPAVVCIGPVTAAAARRSGLSVAAVADQHTEDGLVDALVRVLG